MAELIDIDLLVEPPIELCLGVEEQVYINTTNNTAGPQGQAGLSAYQIAVNNGFVGSESQWIISLQGNSKLVIDEPVTGVIDGSNAIFTVQNLFSTNKFALYLNGVMQRIAEDYQISGQNIILTVSPSVGEKITVSYIIL